MTRQEFIGTKRRWRWFIIFPGYVSLLVMIASPFLWMHFQAKQPDMPPAARIAGGVVCIGVFIFVFWFVYFYLRPIEERRCPHRCPSCKKGFAATEKMVLESGKCWYCGFKVIDDVA
jgi:hypothetical protein